jgi:endo-1,4-beta-xylanase
MVAFSSLVVALSAVAGSLAVPADYVKKDVAERGPKNFVLGPDNALARRSSINYNQDYTTGGTVNYSPSSTGFSVNWNTQNDFVVGVGWQPGSTR